MPGFAGGAASLGESVLKLTTDSKPLEKGLKSAEDKARVAGAKMGKALQTGLAKHSEKLKSIGTKMTLGLSLEIAGFAAGVVAASAKFESGMNKVQAVSGATAAEMKQLSDLAKDLGATTKFSASEAAEGMSFLSMAGFAANETIAAMPGLLSLAAAGGLELGEAADIASNVLSGFGENADQAGRTADILAYTAANANTSVSQLGEAMSYVAPVAASVGLTMEETAAMIGKLGDAGIQSTRAGTALRGMIAQLLEPSESGAKALKHLGVVTHDAGGRMRPLGDILQDLGKSGMDAQQAMAIFGRIAAPAGLVLAQTAEQTKQLATELNNSAGAADEMSNVMMRGLSGAWTEFKSATEGLFIAIGESGLTGFLEGLIDRITVVVRWMGTWSKTSLAVATVIGGLVAAVGPVLIALGTIGALLPGFIAGLGAVVTKIKLWTSAQWLLNTAMSANPIGLVITAVSTLVAIGLPIWLSRSAEKARLLGGAMREINEATATNTAQKIKKLNGLLAEQREKLKAVETQITKSGGHFKRGLERQADDLREHIKRTSAAIRVQEFNQRREARDTARQKVEAAKAAMDAQIAAAAGTDTLTESSERATKQVFDLAAAMKFAADEASRRFAESMREASEYTTLFEQAGRRQVEALRQGTLAGAPSALPDFMLTADIAPMQKLTPTELAKLEKAGEKAGGRFGAGLERAMQGASDAMLGTLLIGGGSFSARLTAGWRSVVQNLQHQLVRGVGRGVRNLKFAVDKLAAGARGAWEFLKDAAKLLAGLGKTAFKGIAAVGQGIGSGLAAAWTEVLKPLANFLWADFLKPIWTEALKPLAEFLWADIIRPIWGSALRPLAAFLWSELIRPLWDHALRPLAAFVWSELIKPLWTEALRPLAAFLWTELIKPIWTEALRPLLGLLWEELIRPIWTKALKPLLEFVWDNLIKPIWEHALQPLAEFVWDKFLTPIWEKALKPLAGLIGRALGFGGKNKIADPTGIILDQGVPKPEDLPDFPGDAPKPGAGAGQAFGLLNAITGVISAASGVIGNFQAHGRGKDLEEIARTNVILMRALIGFDPDKGRGSVDEHGVVNAPMSRKYDFEVGGVQMSATWEDTIHGSLRQIAVVTSEMGPAMEGLFDDFRAFHADAKSTWSKELDFRTAFFGGHTLDTMQTATAMYRESMTMALSSVDSGIAALQSANTAGFASVVSAISAINIPAPVIISGAKDGFASGTDYVGESGNYELHAGEAVLTARENARLSRIDRIAASLQDMQSGRGSSGRPIKLALELEVDDSRRLHVKNLRRDSEFGDVILDVVKTGVRTNQRGVRSQIGEVRSVRGAGAT